MRSVFLLVLLSGCAATVATTPPTAGALGTQMGAQIGNAMAQAQSMQVQAYLAQGQALYGQGQYALALQAFETAAELDPSNAEVKKRIFMAQSALAGGTSSATPTATQAPTSSNGLGAGLPSIEEPQRTGMQSKGDSAVVIGIEDYLKIPDVPYAQRDADAFRELLVYSRGIPLSQVQHLDGEGSREQILDAVARASSEGSSDGLLWVYFAGHGAADPSTGERVLLGDDVRSDPGSFSARSVKLDEIYQAAGDRKVMMVVDACYSGMGRTGTQLSDRRFAVPAYAVDAGGGKHIEWNAAGPDELSGPLDGARHGAFTYLAVGALRGWADGEITGQPDGTVTAEEAHAYVTRQLKIVGKRDQQPVMVGGGAQALTTGSLAPAP